MTRVRTAIDYVRQFDNVDATGLSFDADLLANARVLADELRRLPAGMGVGGVCAVLDSQRRDLDHLKAEIESLRREVAALRQTRSDGAPAYPGHVWSTRHVWSGPFHLVPVTTHPYPGRPELPDVWAPAAKALCGAPYTGETSMWPKAAEVCVGCAATAERTTGVTL